MRGIPEPVLDVLRTLHRAGFLAYVVGGPVRDLLLNREPRDWDAASNADPQAILGLFSRVNPVGARHGTVGVFHKEMWIEITRFRDPGCTLPGDLALRDFTVNAMAIDSATGRLIDPLGGETDLKNLSLRACGSADERFQEDGLRVLRAGRFFSELGLLPDAALTAAARREHARLSLVAPERIRDEWLKLLLGKNVRGALQWCLDTEVSALLFPAMIAARGVEQNRYHRWDVYGHTVETVARAVPKADVRLAAWFHDLGKPATRRRKAGDWTFYGHEQVSAQIAAAELDRFKVGHELRERVVSLVSNHMFHYAPEWSDAAVRRFLQRVGPELLDPLFELRRADSSAAGLGGEAEVAANLAALQHRIAAERSRHNALQIADLAIDGHDVKRLAGHAGPVVGAVLRAMLDKVVDDPSINERERLLREAEAWINAAGKPEAPTK